MVLREESEEAVVCIGQTSHSWLAGQLARAWGNERMGDFSPREEVCLGAEQHDVGWLTAFPARSPPRRAAEHPRGDRVQERRRAVRGALGPRALAARAEHRLVGLDRSEHPAGPFFG